MVCDVTESVRIGNFAFDLFHTNFDRSKSVEGRARKVVNFFIKSVADCFKNTHAETSECCRISKIKFWTGKTKKRYES